MTAGVVGVLAEALALHQLRYDARGCKAGCTCGAAVFHKDHAAHVASVVAGLPTIAIVPTGETTRRYSAAYRDTFGTVVPVGVDYRKRAWAEETRDEWKRDDSTVDVFIAYRDVPEWQEADQ